MVLGRPKPITLDAVIIEFIGSPESVLSGLSLTGPSLAGTNSLGVWVLSDRELKLLGAVTRRASDVRWMARPRMGTADKIESRMFVGNTISVSGATRDIGLTISFLPRLHEKSTDLTTSITLLTAVTNQAGASMEFAQGDVISIRTNFAAAARIQIAKGSGVFLLDTGDRDTHRKRTGVIISTTFPKK